MITARKSSDPWPKGLPRQRKQPVRLSLPYSGEYSSIEVPGYRFGPFTLHRSGRAFRTRGWLPETQSYETTGPVSWVNEEGWTITHARSGYACVERVRWRYLGEACAWFLGTNAHWGDARPSLTARECKELSGLLKKWRAK